MSCLLHADGHSDGIVVHLPPLLERKRRASTSLSLAAGSPPQSLDNLQG